MKEVHFLGNARVTDRASSTPSCRRRRAASSRSSPHRHLPRGRVPARPPGDPGALPRPRLRQREGRQARRSRSRRTSASSTSPSRSRRASSTPSARSPSPASSSSRSPGSAHPVGLACPGRSSRARELAADLFAVGDVYKDHGHAYANVTPLTAIDPERRIVDLTFDVQPGPKVYFERIEIVGNDEDPRQGHPARAAHLRGRALQRHQLEHARSSASPPSASSRRVDITDQAGRDRRQDRRAGRGEGAPHRHLPARRGLLLRTRTSSSPAQIPQNNFFGWGQTLSLQVQWSSIRQLGQIQFVEPYFLDTELDLRLRPLRDRGLLLDLHPALGRRLARPGATSSDRARLVVDVRAAARGHAASSAPTRTSGGRAPPRRPPPPRVPVQGGHHAARSGLSLQWDKRDNRLFPSRGFFALGLGGGGAAVLAPTRALRRRGQPLHALRPRRARLPAAPSGLVARAKLTLGSSTAGMPAPGAHLRALLRRRHQLGPRLPLPSISPATRWRSAARQRPGALPTRGFSVGRRQAADHEPRAGVPALREGGHPGRSSSTDTGNAFAPRQLHRTPKTVTALAVTTSVGFGFRWFCPIGPLRFEWGIPLDRRSDPSTAGTSTSRSTSSSRSATSSDQSPRRTPS